MDQQIIDKLKDRYAHVHPLIFHHSVNRAKSGGDLFDILDTLPEKYPLIWDEQMRRWVVTDDLFQIRPFLEE